MKKRYKKQAKVAMAVALATSSVVNSTGHILAQEETKVNEYNSIDNEEVKEEQEIEEDLLEEESKEVEAKQEVEEKNLETIEREEIQNTDQIEEVIINKENFPDAIFREYIRSKFDRNQDGILSSTELDAVIEIFLTNVHVSNSREITSLKGIEYFKNLKNLYCQKTGITSIDVSKNTALRHIEVNGSYLEEIDVSKNTALEKLLCFDMPNLMSINVQGASALKTLYCYNNPKLRGLDVSGNPNLEYLYIKGTTNYLGTDLAWLKMGGHPKLQDNDSYFKAITSEINIGEVDRTFNIKEMFPGIELDRITNVTGAEIDLTTGVVSNYRNEQIITYQYRTGGTISGAKSILLNVQLRFQTHATPRAQEIAVVQGREPNPADGIANKDSLMEGTTYEWEGGAPDTSEIGIVTGNIILHYPDGFDDRVDNVSVNVGIEINEENFPDAIFREYVGGKYFDKNQDGILSSTELDAVTAIHVTSSYVSNPRELTSLKGIEYFKNLETLYCYGTGITSIDVSQNTALELLYVNDTPLEEIDVSKNPSLKQLNCSDMPNLTSINVQGASALTRLDCYNNPKLRGLDVSGNKELNILNVESKTAGSYLAWLHVGENPNLSNISGTSTNIVNSTIDMGEVARTFNIKEQFPGIDPTKITSISGATIDKETGVVVRSSATVTYAYDSGIKSGNGKVILNVTLNFTRQNADDYAPQGKDLTVYKGEAVNVEDGIANKDALPQGTSYDWKETPNTSEEGTVEGTIVVTYPDRSSEEVTINIHVRVKDVEKYTPVGQAITSFKGEVPNAADGIANKGDLPEGTSYDWKETPDTSAEGTVEGTIVVTYPDRTSEEVIININVVTKNAETYEPQGQDLTVFKGETLNAADGIANKGDLPEGTSYDWKETPDTSAEGTVEGTIVVTYPDRTSEEVIININVATKNAETYEPQGKDLTVFKGETPNAADGIANKGDLPEGTSYDWKETPDTSAEGTVEGTIVVSYPDRTSEEVIININVATKNTETYEPQGQDLTVFKGETPNAADGIANKDALPQGTTYTWAQEPNTSAEGTVEGTIVVTYPDRTSEEVIININVVTKNAETYEPQGQDLDVFKGETPNAVDGIANKSDLPEGTSYDWKETPDTSAEGTVQGTIVVTYPDRTSEEVTININITIKDEEKYTPIVDNNKEINKGENPKAEDFIVNKDELPNGTKYEWIEEPDTSVEGTTTGVLKVTYPDGTSDICDVTMNVVSKEEISPEQGWITIEGTLDKRYDGQAVLEPTVKKPEGSGEVTFEWYTADGIKLDKAPVDAGSYKVKVILEANENYTGAEVEIEFEIYKAITSVSIIGELSKEYDGKPVATPEVKVVGSTGQVSYEWYRKEETAARAITWTRLEEAPVEIGSYKLVVRVAGDKNYEGAMAEKEFTISKVGENTPDNPVVVPTPPTGGTITNPDGGEIVVKPGDNIESNGPVVENPDGSITFPNGGTVTKPDGSIEEIQPGGTLNPNKPEVVPTPPTGGIITNPDGGEIVVKPGDNIESNGPVVENPDGSITFPNGGTVTKPDGSTEVIQPGGVLNPNKPEVVPTPPNGGIITNPDGGEIVVKPGDNIESNGPVVENPDGSITFPNGGTVTNPDGSEEIIQPGGVLNPNKPVVVPTPPYGGIIVNPDGGEIVVKPGDNIESNGPVVENPDGSITFPNGGTVTKPDGSEEIIQPGGTLKPNEPEVVPTPPNGGTITNPDGGEIVVKPGDNIESNGPVVENPDGSITFPNGGTVTKPDGSTEVIQPGATLKPNGKEEIVQPGENINGVQTGDKTQVGLWSILAGLSTGMMMFFRRKRKKEE